MKSSALSSYFRGVADLDGIVTFVGNDERAVGVGLVHSIFSLKSKAGFFGRSGGDPKPLIRSLLLVSCLSYFLVGCFDAINSVKGVFRSIFHCFLGLIDRQAFICFMYRHVLSPVPLTAKENLTSANHTSSNSSRQTLVCGHAQLTESFISRLLFWLILPIQIASQSNSFTYVVAKQISVVPAGVGYFIMTSAGAQGRQAGSQGRQAGSGISMNGSGPAYGAIAAAISLTHLSTICLHVYGAGKSGMLTNTIRFNDRGSNYNNPNTWEAGAGGVMDVGTLQRSLPSRAVVATGGGSDTICNHSYAATLGAEMCSVNNREGRLNGELIRGTAVGSGGTDVTQMVGRVTGRVLGVGDHGANGYERGADGRGGGSGGCDGGSSCSSRTIFTQLQGIQSGDGYMSVAIAGCSSINYISKGASQLCESEYFTSGGAFIVCNIGLCRADCGKVDSCLGSSVADVAVMPPG